MIQLARFVVVGLMNTALGYIIIFAAMYGLGWSPIASNVAGYAVGLVASFVLNRRFTFRMSGRARPDEIGRFLVVFLIGYLANLATLVWLIRGLDVNEGLSQLLAGAVYVGVVFLLNKFYVFRKAA